MKTLIVNASIWKWSFDGLKHDHVEMNIEGSVVRNAFIQIEDGVIVNIGKDNDKTSAPNADQMLNLDELKDMDRYDVVVDANHQLVIPGLIDSHIHVLQTGESQYFIDFIDCHSIEHMLQKIQEHNANHPDLPCIQGVNWDQTKLGRYPNRVDLDATLIEKPIFLWRACWHIGVANTSAMVRANVDMTATQFEIAGGRIDVFGDIELSEQPPPPKSHSLADADTRNRMLYLGPTGIFRENAVTLILNALGKKSFIEKSRFISDGLQQCVRNGLTMVQTNDDHCLSVYQQLLAQRQLPMRVFLTPNQDELNDDVVEKGGIQHLNPIRPRCYDRVRNEDVVVVNDDNATTTSDMKHDTNNQSSKLANTTHTNATNDITAESALSRLAMDRVKIYSDGSLGAETAAIRKIDSSYESAKIVPATTTDDNLDNEDSKSSNIAYQGLLMHATTELRRLVAQAKAAGFRVEIHAIGDAAAAQVIDALETTYLITSGVDKFILNLAYTTNRPIITHCQVLAPDLIAKMSRYGGIIANIQPSFVPTDMRWITSRVSPVQQQYSYVWKMMLEAGVPVAGGSDAPIETTSPFTGMYDAIFRSDRRRQTTQPVQQPSTKLTTDNHTENRTENVLLPDQCLSFAEALYIYTIGGAYAANCEHRLGRIQPGFIADLVFVDPDIVPNPELLYQYKPYMVMVGGQVVCQNEIDRQDKKTPPTLLKSPRQDPLMENAADVQTNPRTGTTEVVMSDSVYTLGKNGYIPSYYSTKNNEINHSKMVRKQDFFRLGAGMTGFSCACILKGQFNCSEYSYALECTTDM